MPSPSFDRIAGLCALLAGLSSLVSALAFLVLRNSGLSALVLLVGLLSAPALVAVYLHLSPIVPGQTSPAPWNP